jgi:hypothetical protein
MNGTSGVLALPLIGAGKRVAHLLPSAYANGAPGHAVAENLNFGILETALQRTERRALRVKNDAGARCIDDRGPELES